MNKLFVSVAKERKLIGLNERVVCFAKIDFESKQLGDVKVDERGTEIRLTICFNILDKEIGVKIGVSKNNRFFSGTHNSQF